MGQNILPELQQETEDTARSIKGDRRYSQIYKRGQKIQPEKQLETEDKARAIAGDRR